MKRSEVISMLSEVVSRRNTGHYSYNEKAHAEDVLRFLESLGIIAPTYEKTVIRRDIEAIPYEDTIIIKGWEDE